MNLIRITTPLLLAFLLLAAACGGDDDDASSSSSSSASSNGSSSGTTNAAPTEATGDDDADGGDGDSSSASSSGGDGGSRMVTIGGDTWTLVPDQCEATDEGGIPVFTIAGHAEADDAIEIVINFDPRDIGLEMTVMGPGGDPSWTADPDVTVQAGGPLISGEGSFSSAAGEAADGSFRVVC
jgi:hypothetical protein